MKKIHPLIVMAAAASTLLLGGKALAQPQGDTNLLNMNPQEFQNRVQQFQNMDPQQRQAAIQQFQTTGLPQLQGAVQQRVSDALRQQMDVTNDDDWAIIQEKITAVTKAKTVLAADGGGITGLAGTVRGSRGGRGGGGFQALLGRPSQELQALQAAVNNHAPVAQIKDLMNRFQTAHDAKQAALTKAQEDLRSVLTTRQEAIALLGGLLN